MTKSKHTQKALLASVMSLLLCFAMLIGTTFAWFTDAVSNKGNKIQAGVLDVQLLKDGEDISNSEEKVFHYNLWEPGYSTGASLAVKNNGTLALKYELAFQNITVKTGLENATDDLAKYEDHLANATGDISEVLDIYLLDSNRAPTAADTPAGTLKDFIDGKAIRSGFLLAGQTSEAVNIVVKMQENASNAYQNASADFDILLRATQHPYEADGFGNDQYDKEAKYPSAIYIPADKVLDDTASIVTGLTGNTVVTAPSKTLTFGNNSKIGQNTAVDMKGTAQAVKDSINAENGQSLTMINGELVKSTTFGKIRFDTKGEEQIGLFENMTFTDTLPPSHLGSSSKDTEEMIQICPNGGGAGTYIFRGCTFNDANVTLNGMNDGAPVEIIFENCTFNNTGNADAIEINPNYITGGSVKIKDCTFNLVTTTNIYAVDLSGTSKVSLAFEGENRVNGSVADSSIYKLFDTTSVKAYNCKNVTGAETITVSGIATKE